MSLPTGHIYGRWECVMSTVCTLHVHVNVFYCMRRLRPKKEMLGDGDNMNQGMREVTSTVVGIIVVLGICMLCACTLYKGCRCRRCHHHHETVSLLTLIHRRHRHIHFTCTFFAALHIHALQSLFCCCCYSNNTLAEWQYYMYDVTQDGWRNWRRRPLALTHTHTSGAVRHCDEASRYTYIGIDRSVSSADKCDFRTWSASTPSTRSSFAHCDVLSKSANSMTSNGAAVAAHSQSCNAIFFCLVLLSSCWSKHFPCHPSFSSVCELTLFFVF